MKSSSRKNPSDSPDQKPSATQLTPEHDPSMDLPHHSHDAQQLRILAHALKSSNDCITITDEENIILFVNNAFLETYGYTQEELIGQHISIVRGPEETNHVIETIRTNTIRGEWKGELLNKKKDGTVFPISLSTSVVRDDDGIPIALIGVARDITEQKKISEALRDSEATYRGLFNSVTEAIYIHDTNGEFIDVNEGAMKMYGYTREEFLGKTPEMLSAPGLNDPASTMHHIQEALAGRPQVFEWWGRRKNGEIFPKEVVLNRGIHFGQNVLIASARDIRDRKRVESALRLSEKKFRDMFESAPVGIYQSSLRGTLLSVNQALVEMLGYTSQEEVLQLDLARDVYKRASDRSRFIEELDEHGHIGQMELEWKRKDGSEVWVHINAHTIRGIDGAVQYFEGFVQDITERKAVERQMRAYTHELAELNANKDKFFSIISHDLRSPFSTLLGFADLVDTGFDSMDEGVRRRYISNIHTVSKQIFSLLENLLQWSRLQQGKIIFQPVTILLHDFVDDILTIHQGMALKKEIRIENTIPEHTRIHADQNMLQSIIENLLTNAIKFTGTGGEVRIHCAPMEGAVLISVKDSGVGIAPSNISKLLRIDQHYSSLGTAEEKGTGLGLILCKEFVEQHQGKIWIESEPGKGSTFSFSLPTL